MKNSGRLRAAFLLPPVLLCCALLAGCARYPANQTTGSRGKQLLVTMRVRGQIQPFDAQTPYYYFFLINRPNAQSDAGPVPVVGTPWGNGFAAASQPGAQGFVGFVRYSFRDSTLGGYGVYRVEGNPVNGFFTPLGRPDDITTPQRGEATLAFRLDLSRLPNPDAHWLQLNIIATNNIPQGTDDSVSKFWDALGDSHKTFNQWITITTDQNIILRNSEQSSDLQEPAGDVRDKNGAFVDEPNLDIVDWTVEIRSQ